MLRADCSNCFGLCCTVLPLTVSADFAIDKAADTPCPNLSDGFGCTIHADLRDRGFKGCSAFDCFGAGQQVSQVTFDGVSWRADRASGPAMFEVFGVMLRLHELLWYLTQAYGRTDPGPLHDDLAAALATTERATAGSADAVLAFDLTPHLGVVDALLTRTSETVRRGYPRRRGSRFRPGADLAAAALDGTDLRGSNLRGALLIAADLHNADLRDVDLIGADLRDADLRGADLSDALFLTGGQLASATGDDTTLLPEHLPRPGHWST